MYESILNLATWLSQHPGWIFAAVATIAFLESLFVVGVIMPGAVLLFAVAALAGGLDMPLIPLLLSASVGAIGGDVVSFFIGREIEHLAHDRPLMQRWRPQYEAAHRFFERWGILGVVVGRFVGPARPFLPAVAGAAGMSRRVFIAADIVSGLAWAPVYILPGYLSATAFY